VNAEQLLLEVRSDPVRGMFALQLNFSAVNADVAPAVAATLVQGLATLCPHVDPHSALIWPAGVPGCAQPVFCAEPGPDGALCEDLRGHPGWHAEAGVSGLRWGVGDTDGGVCR
jgi:hypothetical protein